MTLAVAIHLLLTVNIISLRLVDQIKSFQQAASRLQLLVFPGLSSALLYEYSYMYENRIREQHHITFIALQVYTFK